MAEQMLISLANERKKVGEFVETQGKKRIKIENKF